MPSPSFETERSTFGDTVHKNSDITEQSHRFWCTRFCDVALVLGVTLSHPGFRATVADRHGSETVTKVEKLLQGISTRTSWPAPVSEEEWKAIQTIADATPEGPDPGIIADVSLMLGEVQNRLDGYTFTARRSIFRCSR